MVTRRNLLGCTFQGHCTMQACTCARGSVAFCKGGGVVVGTLCAHPPPPRAHVHTHTQPSPFSACPPPSTPIVPGRACGGLVHSPDHGPDTAEDPRRIEDECGEQTWSAGTDGLARPFRHHLVLLPSAHELIAKPQGSRRRVGHMLMHTVCLATPLQPRGRGHRSRNARVSKPKPLRRTFGVVEP